MGNFDIQSIQLETENILDETLKAMIQDTSLTFWKTTFGKDIVLRNLQLTYVHFKSILILSKNTDTLLVISATPICRAVSEILFGIIYIFENFENRTLDSAKSFVREGKREIRIFRERYLNKSDEWNKWISKKPQKLEKIQNNLENEFSALGHSEFDWDNDKNRFPRLSKMKESFPENSETRNFLEFLEDVHNRELSSISHSEPYAAVLFGVFLNNKGQGILQHFNNHIIGLSFVVMLSLVSEIESNLNYGLKPRLKEVWTKLVSVPETEIAKEFYEMRYQTLLQ